MIAVLCQFLSHILFNTEGDFRLWRPMSAPGCKNSARSVYWPEVIKGIPNQGVVFC